VSNVPAGTLKRTFAVPGRTLAYVAAEAPGVPVVKLPVRALRVSRAADLVIGGSVPGTTGPAALRIEKLACRQATCRSKVVARLSVIAQPRGTFTRRVRGLGPGVYRVSGTLRLVGTARTATVTVTIALR
jgi:hypothetical protein